MLPSMRECVKFGEARDWGLRVIVDLAEGEASIIPASDQDLTALLVSPPGHGKTYFARVLAHSLNANLIELTTGSIFSNDGHLERSSPRCVLSSRKRRKRARLFC